MVSVMYVINVSSVSCVQVAELKVVICCSATIYVVHIIETPRSEVKESDTSATYNLQ